MLVSDDVNGRRKVKRMEFIFIPDINRDLVDASHEIGFEMSSVNTI